VYGRVNGSDGFPLDSVSVTANGMSVQTDASGRFIIDGIAAQTRKIDDVTHSNKIFLQGSRAGFDDSDLMILEFAANSLTRNDFAMGGTAKTATISGTVTAFGSTTGVSGVEIRVDGNAPENKNAKSMSSAPKNDIYVTGDDGSYSIKVPAKATGMTSRISAHKDGYTFTPAHLDLSTPDGAAISGINFQAVANSSISGRVQAPGGGPLGGVAVTATGSTGSDADTTGVTGTYSLSVPAGTYTMAFAKDGYSFTCPGEPASCSVTVGLGQSVTLGDAMSVVDETIATLSALSLSGVTLDPAFSSDVTDYSADVANDVEQTTVTATTTDSNASVEVLPAEADDAMDGHQVALSVGTTRITATVTAADSSTTETYTVDVTRANVHPTVTLMLSADTIAEAADDGTGTNVVQTATVTAMVSPMADSAFTVTVSIGDDTWATLSDSVTRSFAANAAASTGTVTITTVDDNVYTGNRTVTVSGASSDAAVAADPADVMLTITDNETGQVPGAVQGLAAEAGDRQVKVTWGQPLNTGSDPITGYKWTATTANRLPLNGEVGAAARELTITNLENGLAYSLSVWAVNAAGETATGDRATAVTATPVPVITLTLSENSLTEGGSDTLTATVSLSSVSNVEVSVAVAEIVDGTARLTVEGSPVTIPVGQMTPAAGGTPITVFAQDNATDDGDAAAMLQATSANGADSDTLEVTIVDDDEVPGAPRNLTLTAGDATITAEWISPADAGSAAITSYQYRVYETADGAPAADAADQGWETATSPQAAATVTTADGDPAVENDTEYTVEVRAVSTAGNGAIASATATPASS
ncbi:MAG: fibronectin type III domain-containing protein, partial [Chloroflexota bacterium]|nr:fibronectin type III domain-containing protein [Chloroflexota bacterium]